MYSHGMTTADRVEALGAVRNVAAAQHGLILTGQLLRAGLGWRGITALRRDGWIISVRHGVYLVGLGAGGSRGAAGREGAGRGDVAGGGDSAGGGPTPWQQVVAAHLAAGPASVLSHSTAARVHRLPCVVELDSERPVELTVIQSRRPGSAVLRELLEPRRGEPVGDSVLEQRAARALAGLGPFMLGHQEVIEGGVVVLDIAWPEVRVAAECDGWAVRSRSHRKFDHDRRRGNLLEAHGWSVAHLTSAMSDEEMRAAVFPLLMRAAAVSGRGPARW